MRTMKRGMTGEDIRLLHAILNFHLPLPFDQLPTTGTGASDFGPRTENKVKEFQKLIRMPIRLANADTSMHAASARIRLARNRFAFPRSAAACRWRIASSRGADA